MIGPSGPGGRQGAPPRMWRKKYHSPCSMSSILSPSPQIAHTLWPSAGLTGLDRSSGLVDTTEPSHDGGPHRCGNNPDNPEPEPVQQHRRGDGAISRPIAEIL